MALKVIGAGFGRTGTMSMQAALQQLGYDKCHHMMEVFPSADQVDAWHKVSQGADPDWETIFDGYQACVDYPSAAYWRELATYYPDAKIILTTRDFDSWYASATETIYALSIGIPKWTMLIPRVRKAREMVYGAIWDRLFEGQFEDKEAARRVFEQHEADVKAAFPDDRLLVFHPKQGWQPLCTFLGKPVPDGAFPNINDRDSFTQRLSMLRWLKALPWMVGAAGIAALLAYLAFQ